MQNHKVNINSIKKNLPELMNLVMNGDEIIITKSDIPIAKISPINNSKHSIKSTFLSAKSIESKRSLHGELPENWFG